MNKKNQIWRHRYMSVGEALSSEKIIICNPDNLHEKDKKTTPFVWFFFFVFVFLLFGFLTKYFYSMINNFYLFSL